MSVGAPVRVPISSGAIIVAQASSGTGTAKFSFKVVGVEYTWYEKPFVGVNVVWYYMYLITLVIAALLVVCTGPTFNVITVISLALAFVTGGSSILVGGMLITVGAGSIGLLICCCVPILCCCCFSLCRKSKPKPFLKK